MIHGSSAMVVDREIVAMMESLFPLKPTERGSLVSNETPCQSVAPGIWRTKQMRAMKIACVAVVLIAFAAVLPAADSRSYGKTIELTWDEAVKAARDAELTVTDSNRSEHWFTMKSAKKTLSKSVNLEVSVTEAGSETRVEVRELDYAGTKKSYKAIAAYFAALDKRMR